MNNRPTEPLSAEERELAALLGRIGPHGEPSPALDAKVLAAAHDAVTRDTARAPVRRRRWPALAGLAASLLIAAGIGWQLLPRHEAAMQVSEAPVAAVMIDGNTEAADAAAPAAAKSVAPPPPPPPPPPPEFKPSPTPIKQLAPPRSAPVPPPAVERLRDAPPVDVAEPRATDIVVSPAAPPPAAPPPPPAPAPEESAALLAPGAVQAPRAFEPAPAAVRQDAYARKAAAAPAPVTNTGAEAKAAANDSATLDSVMVTGSRADELDVLGIEVEADTRLSKRAWLHRIELRRTQGDTDGARESLRLFVKKYPRATLPPELRDLLKE